MKIVVPRRETNPQRNKETSPTSRLGRKLIHKLKKYAKCAPILTNKRTEH